MNDACVFLYRDHTARMLALDPDARFPEGGSVLAALRELEFELEPSPHRARLPAATAQMIERAPTQRRCLGGYQDASAPGLPRGGRARLCDLPEGMPLSATRLQPYLTAFWEEQQPVAADDPPIIKG